MSESEMRICLAQLEALEAQIEAVATLFGDKQQLFGPEKHLAQEQLRVLKKMLDDEYRRTSTVRGQASLNPTAKAFYAPAVHEAKTEIRVKTSSKPDAQWIAELFEAAGTIRYYASGLREQLKQ